MKKIFLAAIAATAIFASCSKDTVNTITTTEPLAGAQVQISLADDRSGTRAFFDETAAAQRWESAVKTLTIYVFDDSDNIIVKRTAVQAEIDTKTVRFTLPGITRGMTCSFYAVANDDYGDPANITELTGRKENSTIGEYNGIFDATNAMSIRKGGFVMNGKTTTTIGGEDDITLVDITLRRIVAKIAVRTQISENIANKYGGKVTITSATLSQVQEGAYSFPDAGVYNPGVGNFSHTQESNPNAGTYRNIFYAYECGASAREYRVKLSISGYYDADGLDTTTNDRSEVLYVIYVEGNGDGEISRNGYYRVDATVRDLSADAVFVNFTVADWQIPVTQTTDLGV